MHSIEIKSTKAVPVKFLRAQCGVRYWEDGRVNGVEDEHGTKTPHKQGDIWDITIDLESGTILDWPQGTELQAHYKVCDAGVYMLLDADKNIIKSIDGYVPSMLSPGGEGYGDYVIMYVSESGKIDNWQVNLDAFESEAA